MSHGLVELEFKVHKGLVAGRAKVLAAFRPAKHPPAMKQPFAWLAAWSVALPLLAADPSPRGNELVAEYFRNETAVLTARCLADIQTLDDWQTKRDEYRRQLQEMLGLWPMPERTDLKPVVTGKIESSDFTVEKIHFQASPGLYCTANL